MSDEDETSSSADGGWVSSFQARVGQQAAFMMSGGQEPMDVVWVSGSAIAVGTRPTVQPETIVENPDARMSANFEGDGNSDADDIDMYDSDTTVEYPSLGSPYTIESLSGSDDADDADDDTMQNDQLMNGNAVIIIERENSESNIVQEPFVQQPDLVSLPENPNVGIENPIIRLENPHYEPDAAKSPVIWTPNRSSAKRSYGTMISEDEDGQTCPVCFDVWTSDGDHRLCSLKCGHLFGKSCIHRWLAMEKKKHCPQCNLKATVNDIRELYATKLTAMDSSEKTRLEKEVEEIKEQKKKLEIDLLRCNFSLEMYRGQLDALRLRLANLESGGTGNAQKDAFQKPVNAGPSNFGIKFHLEKTFEVHEGSCRVSAFSPNNKMLIVSHQTRNALFPGFGVKKIRNVGSEYSGNNFLFLHMKMLRDLCFHPTIPNLLLSVSFDKTAKLSDVEDQSVIQTYKTSHPLWSCCWDGEDPNIFYIGAGNGLVTVFDYRLPSEIITSFNPTDDFGAVVALRSAPPRPASKGGVICCRLNSVVLYEKVSNTEYNPIPLSTLVGPFFSLSYNVETQHILASCRPSEEHPKVRHVYCELEGSSCRKVHTFCGGTRQTMLSRSCFVKVNEENLVAVFQENSNSIELWSTSTGNKIQSITVSDHVMDLISMQIDNKRILGGVSDKLIRFFEASCVR